MLALLIVSSLQFVYIPSVCRLFLWWQTDSAQAIVLEIAGLSLHVMCIKPRPTPGYWLGG